MKSTEEFMQRYSSAADKLAFSDKRRLYALYDEKRRYHAPKRAFAAVIAAAVILAVTVTAGAAGANIWRGDGWSELRETIAARFAGLGLPDYQIDNLTDRYENLDYDTQDFADRDLHLDVNDYEETVGWLNGVADLQKVGAEDGTEGYIYRYDYGMFPNWHGLLLPEERTQIYSDGTLSQMFARGEGETYSRNWVYVFDRNGMEILGKWRVGDLKFRTNTELEDPNISKLFYDGAAVPAYDELVQDRIDYKKANGRAPETEKNFRLADLPEEGFSKTLNCCFLEDIALSDAAAAVSSDPSVAEIYEVVTIGSKTDKPYSYIAIIFHKIGTCTVTITDGEDEYVFEETCVIGRLDYTVTDERIK